MTHFFFSPFLQTMPFWTVSMWKFWRLTLFSIWCAGRTTQCMTVRYVHYRPPGETFLTFFFKGKNLFFPNFCEKTFPGAFKIALKCPFQSLYLQTISWGSPPDPHLQHWESCSTQKFGCKKKEPENANFWLKRWLHVTNPDYKKCLWVFGQYSL